MDSVRCQPTPFTCIPAGDDGERSAAEKPQQRRSYILRTQSAIVLLLGGYPALG